ncbi:MAG: ATPase [Lachnospiraceae bacterium]|nr:ATPase [Lachnospiraceae bacterium]
MIFTEVTLSYPCVQHKVEVSHFTARKSTAIEWVILEAIHKCKKLSYYAEITIASFFEQIFTISDADLLIRPVLISLQDIGAITISGIDDETELDTVVMSNLKLTKTGREMQIQGLLPGTSSEETFSIYYDVAAKALKDEAGLYKEESSGIRVIDIDDADDLEFPEGAIREWLFAIQNDKKHKKFHWLTPTTNIESVTRLSSELYWKNIIRKVEIVDGMRWKVSGVEDEDIDEITLKAFDIFCPDDLSDLPYLEIMNPDKEIKKLISIDEINALIGEFLQKDDFFCIEAKYYKDVKTNQQNKKKIRIGIVYGADKFEVESSKKQIIIRVPDCDFRDYGLYLNSKESVRACITNVSAGAVSRDIAIAYIPNTNEINLSNIIVAMVDKYYTQDNSILFALYELRLKDMFLEYVNRIISGEKKVADKAKVVELFNEKGRDYYGQNIISAADKERLLVNEAYIIDQCRYIEGAKEVITEYAEINAFRQDESLFQRIMKIVIEHVGEQDSLEDIWDFWQAISSAKKAYINWVSKLGLQKCLYSKRSILDFIGRFTDENFFEIEEYTVVEQIILNMRRISLQVEGLIPELNLYETVSREKYNELVLAHMDVIETLYDQVRKWQDEEERFINKVMDFNEVLEPGFPFTNIKKNMDGLRNALATFFDDSFMRFNKVYIVDTCTLMNEPGLISWFDGEKALLVIPMIVLDELDGFKTSDDDEKAYRAREVIRNISNYNAYDWLNTGEISHPELLSNDLDKERNDNKILSIAIRYCAKKPILLTDDINLGNIAAANKIKNMTLESYQAMKQHEKLTSKGSRRNLRKKR